MNNNPNIQSMLETVERIFDATHKALTAMNDGGRTQIKELTKTVGAMTGMDPKQILGFVSHFVHNTDIAYITRGKFGGVIKGKKGEKAAKVADPAPDADINNTTNLTP